MSIDTGNKMMKTNHFIFHSGIKRKEQKILPGEEGIFFKGINYLESNQRISYLEDKTIDDRYYILTLLGVAKELENSNVPIIMISALSSEADQIKGFELQIDDYIPKPISLPLMIKKIEAIFRRYDKKDEKESNEMWYREICLIIGNYRVIIKGESIDMNKFSNVSLSSCNAVKTIMRKCLSFCYVIF